MPIRREMSGGAVLLDAILYDDVWASMNSLLDGAHLQPSDPLGEGPNDRPSSGPN